MRVRTDVHKSKKNVQHAERFYRFFRSLSLSELVSMHALGQEIFFRVRRAFLFLIAQSNDGGYFESGGSIYQFFNVIAGTFLFVVQALANLNPGRAESQVFGSYLHQNGRNGTILYPNIAL